MTTKELIGEVEALLPSGPGPAVTKFHKWRLLAPLVLDALKAMQAELTAAQSRVAMFQELADQQERHAPPQVIALKNEVERLTVERDEAAKHAAEWEIQAQDFRDQLVAVDGACAGIASAVQFVRAQRDNAETRAEIAEAKALEMAQELAALKSALARLTTPRPIEEAPKDGTWVLVYWDMQPHEPPIVVQAAARGWWDGLRYVEPQPTHFLPLPVKP